MIDEGFGLLKESNAQFFIFYCQKETYSMHKMHWATF